MSVLVVRRITEMLFRLVFLWGRKVPKASPLSLAVTLGFLLLLFPRGVVPDRNEGVDIVLRRCCFAGTEAGLAENPSSSEGTVCGDATVSLFLSALSPLQQTACRGAGKICCLRELRSQQCLRGTQVAKNNSSCDDDSFGQTQKDCCVACKLGAAVASLGGSCTYSAAFPSLSQTWGNTFNNCCKDASNTENPPEERNLCEEMGRELCMHRCIPTKKSYRCECDPGFNLIEDGKSCRLASQTDRCAKSNPCEHYCTDTGLAVECSCKKGFKIAPDGISCLDVDECETSTHLCDNAVAYCRNRKGGYSCVDRETGEDTRMGPDATSTVKNVGTTRNATRCPVGFSYNTESQTCDDIDECFVDEYSCGATGTCKNTIGSFVCLNATIGVCPPGYDRSESTGVCLDIDECARRTDACDRSTHFCVNTLGGFHCEPRSGGSARGSSTGGISNRGGCPAGFKADPVQRGNCIDVDECSENIHSCSPHEICRNTQGAYDCEPRCPIGFFLDPLLHVCRDVDECTVANNSNLCNPNERCVNTPGSYLCVPRAHGNCPAGYRQASSPGLCNDIDECSENPNICPAGTVCINELGFHRCEPIRSQVPDVDVPSTTTGRGPSAPVCSPGFEYDSYSEECIDTDECTTGLHTCSPSERCINTQGSFWCSPSCEPGFRALPDRADCEDIDECAEGTHTCQYSSHVCRNTNGSFVCENLAECQPGYRRGQSGNCEDINECDASPCPARHSCINSVGTYRCIPIIVAPTTGKPTLVRLAPVAAVPSKWCPAGYRHSEAKNTCIDVDECLENTNLCNNRTEVCVNAVGAYRCSPKPTVLVSNSERPSTAQSVASFSSSATSEGTPGTSPSRGSTSTGTQKCPKGYQYSDDIAGCLDIDECATSNPCDATETCRNTPGAFSCNCKMGFRKDPITHACVDINECQVGTARCMEHQRCDNTIGSYMCVRLSSCGTGYTLNAENGKCEDDDECELGTHFCGTERVCRNTLGSFRCEMPPLPECGPGFVANEGSRRCVDLDECENSPCRPGSRCINTVGSFRCEVALVCGNGYQQNENGDECVDIDECSLGSHKCRSGQRCINRPGGYQCLCPQGHRMVDGVCKDVDECTLFKGQVCPPMSTCQNNVGSYQCVCHDGYKNFESEGRHGCTDIDECTETPGICHQRCINTAGSYKCACNTGYDLAADNRTCEDINECELFKDTRRLCIGYCVNQPGSFSCRCPKGYRQGADGRTCYDIDECKPPEENPCKGADEDCFNIRGSYRCNNERCPPGYKRDENNKNRCHLLPCQDYDTACKQLPWTITSAYVSFTSMYPVPGGRFDFFTLRMPNYSSTRPRYTLKLVNVQASDEVPKATESDFLLRQESPTRKIVSLLRPLKGPQDIELHLNVDYYNDRNLHISTVVHKIIIIVSSNEF